jgi:hypothetical protein
MQPSRKVASNATITFERRTKILAYIYIYIILVELGIITYNSGGIALLPGSIHVGAGHLLKTY